MSTKKEKIRQLAARYPRLIEWSQEDKCYVGSAPPLVGHCCHGATEAEVAAQLAIIVADLSEDLLDGKREAPKELVAKKYSGKFVTRIDPGLHKKIALQAAARHRSLNDFVAEALEKAS